MIKMGDDKTVEECVTEGKEVCTRLNEAMNEAFGEGIIWEFENFFDRFLLIKTNGYAGRKAWDIKYETETMTGFDVQNQPFEARLKVQGLALRKVNTAKVGRDIQTTALNMIFSDISQRELLAYFSTIFDRVVNGEVPIEDIQARASLKKHLPHPHRCGCGKCPHIPKTNEKPGKDYDHNKEAYIIQRDRVAWEQYTNGMPTWRILDKERAAAAWHNEFLADRKYLPIEKDDNFWWVTVKNSPIAVPARATALPLRGGVAKNRNHTGVVGYRNKEQIDAFDIDYAACAESHVINHIKVLLEGLAFAYIPSLKDRCEEIAVPPAGNKEETKAHKAALSARKKIVTNEVNRILNTIRGTKHRYRLADFR
jgi:hypothetical protein